MAVGPLQVHSDLVVITTPTPGEGTAPLDGSDALLLLSCSRARAALLESLFVARPRWWGARELGRVSGQPHQTASTELRRLLAARLVRLSVTDGRGRYYPETDDPIAVALARFIRQTRGRIPALRAVLECFEAPSIAWLSGVRPPRALGEAAFDRRSAIAQEQLFVLTSVPRRLISGRLAAAGGEALAIHVMTAAEWMARLAKRDVLIERARRSPKTWVRGTSRELGSLEGSHLQARRTLSGALSDWREQLSDDWDEDWDPLGDEEPAR